MDIDNITDVNELRRLLKTQMVRLEETIETPTHTYKAGEWFFFTQDEDGVFLYEEDPTCGVELSYDEADEIIDVRRYNIHVTDINVGKMAESGIVSIANS